MRKGSAIVPNGLTSNRSDSIHPSSRTLRRRTRSRTWRSPTTDEMGRDRPVAMIVPRGWDAPTSLGLALTREADTPGRLL